MEASWRGLWHLVYQSETGVMLKIRVLNVSKKELLKDLERAPEFDQSALFKKVYEDEYGMFEGRAVRLASRRLRVQQSPPGHVAAGKGIPGRRRRSRSLRGGRRPQLFGWDSFTDLTEVRDLAKIFDRTEYVKWRSFRESEDSRYVGLCLPHTLIRLPYGKSNSAYRDLQL
jgi:type VI secretion system protein ImpC